MEAVGKPHELSERHVHLSEFDSTEVLDRNAKGFRERLLRPAMIFSQLGNAPTDGPRNSLRIGGSHGRKGAEETPL